MDDKPQSWPPYPKDCSQRYCSYYCPQWCFFLFPPPPPPPSTTSSSSSGPLISPLLIAIISITATGFLLAAYYIVLARHRSRRRSSRSSSASPPDNEPSPWFPLHPGGLDQTLIDKIMACQYRAGGGLVADGTDCSVCLGLFEDGDTIRLLPKCSHVFHVTCIDTWLKSNSTCPLCRASIFPTRVDSEAIALVVEEEMVESGSITNESISEREESVDVEDVVEGRDRRLMGRSLSMDTPFRRQQHVGPGPGPSRDASPGRMKRSSSMAVERRSILPT